MTPQIAMRHDIDGLRAIAVIIVMLFHAGLSKFVGADVFFVISGFLILPPLVARIAAGDFSFGDFMARRVRRLVPAILPVLAYMLRSLREVLAQYALGGGGKMATSV